MIWFYVREAGGCVPTPSLFGFSRQNMKKASVNTNKMAIFTVRIYKQYVNTVIASSRVSTLYDHSFLIWCECVL